MDWRLQQVRVMRVVIGDLFEDVCFNARLFDFLSCALTESMLPPNLCYPL